MMINASVDNVPFMYCTSSSNIVNARSLIYIMHGLIMILSQSIAYMATLSHRQNSIIKFVD